MDGVAKEIYALLADLPEESVKIVAGMIVAEGYHDTLGGYDIAKAYVEYLSTQADEIRSSLVRSYVSKREAGSSVDTIAATAEVIAAIHKAAGASMGYTAEEHRAAIKGQPRDSGGRFGNRGGSLKMGKPAKKPFNGLDDVHAVLRNASESKDKDPFLQSFQGGGRNVFTPEVQNYERLQHGARLLHATAAPYLPGSANVALATVGYVGEFGAAAQRTFQPSIDRTKYRYTGTERKIDQKLAAALRSDLGSGRGELSNDRREKFIHGHIGASSRPGEKAGEWLPSKTIGYFRDELPSQRLAALQRFSGHFPPSQGIIIDSKRRVAAQMHGSGDDWYLPFDLSNLGYLKGGEYIRTRTNGGLSTEDVYTGLMSGARSMTVVSHNGVFTMELDDSLRGSRRYSQTAREMTERYGQLLDAVKSGTLRVDQNSIDPFKAQELREAAGGEDVIYQRLREKEKENPTPSAELQEQWGQDFLRDQVDEVNTKEGRTAGHEYTVDLLLAEKVLPVVARQVAEDQNDLVGGAQFYSPQDPEIIAMALNSVESDPMVAVEALGKGREYRRFLDGKLQQYREQLKPVELNGQGYEFAMTALKEQFPYFIKRAEHYPWTDDAVGSMKDKDYGYVKPRFVRPHAAKAGYADKTILGTGKVSADRTRYQNYGVMRGIGDGQGSYEAGYRGGDTDAGGGLMGGRAPEPRDDGGQAKEIKAGKKSPAQLQRDIDLALLKHMREQTHYSPDTKAVDNNNRPLANRPLPPKDAWAGVDPTIAPLAMTDEQLALMPADQLHIAAQRLMALQDTDAPFALDEGIVGTWKNHGNAPALEKWPVGSDGEFTAFTHNPLENKSYDFGNEPEFNEGRSPEQYAKSYETHPAIHPAVVDGELGGIEDPDMPGRANDYILGLQQQYADGKLDERDIKVAHRRIRGAAMAKQLAKRWAEAKIGGGVLDPDSPAARAAAKANALRRLGVRPGDLKAELGVGDIGTKPQGGHYPGAPTMQAFLGGQLRPSSN